MNNDRKVNILLVDDRPENLLALEAVLVSPNYNLIKATSGEEALKFVLKYDCAVILLDVQMPGLNGFETAKLIKKRESSAHIPIIFITAISQANEHVYQGYSVGAVDYIFKPLNPDILKSKVEAFVKLQQYHEQVKQQSFLLQQHSQQLEKNNEQLLKTTSELRKAEALARVIGETSSDTVVTLDEHGEIIQVNPIVKEMFGYTIEELDGQSVRLLLPKLRPDIQQLIIDPVDEDLFSKAKTEAIELKAKRQDESLFPAEVRIGEADVEGQQIYVCFIKDITERKHMELKLQEQFNNLEQLVEEKTEELVITNKDLRHSQERFQKIVESSPNLIAIRSLEDGRFIDVNESWLHFTDYVKEEVANKTKNFLQIIAERDNDDKYTTSLDLEKCVRNAKIQYLTKHGQVREGLLSTEVVEIQNERCIISVITDITDRVHLEKELVRLDRLNLIGEMAAGIAHEIRNPMTTVLGFLQIAKSEDFSQPQEYVNLMIEELNRANAIIKEFLTLAKDKASDQKLKDLNVIVDTIYPLLQAEALLSNKTINLNLGDIPQVYLDEKEIRQLILNIALNGLEAMSEGGELEIETYTSGQSITLKIADQGQGIPQEFLEKIGTPFFTTKDEGTGLGLAVCYSIASRHEAEIELETSDEGTAFYIKFQNVAIQAVN
ncbi:PAS domain S-box protein [Desertibacillus haloalkaliphilus]|uniref:PAS domain S-box protein n=1 Tax=Desertibacillus haloalkaliphilus TaxID=1328930 RepID=UPI001C2698FF|nr:PAS domain S-box protein [Desertibacillus haloalkaliphilus]MBU8907998.1 PAS domain S-box protein [Desertibacillus haloalkaliphilus]